MPSRRQFVTGCAALGLAGTVPAAAAAAEPAATADVDAALAAFGSGRVDARLAPDVLPRVGEAVSVVAAEAPGIADAAAGRLPASADHLESASDGGGLGDLAEADIHAATTDPAIDGVARLAVGVDFTARGPVLRARVTGADGTPSRAAALDALAAAGLPARSIEDLWSVPDGDDLALTAGFDDREGGQPFILALFVVVIAAVIGTFVLGLGDQVSRTAPQASFTFDYRSGGELEITHDGGDSIPAEQLRVRGSDGSPDRRWGRSGTVSAGDSITVAAESDDSVRVIWESPEGGDSATLALWRGPDA